MKPKHTLRHFLAAIGCATFAISSASAQTDGTWNQTGTANPYNWSDIANWLDDIVASGTDSTASFTVDASGAQTVELDTAVTLGNLTLDRNQNLTITGPEALTLDVSSGTPILNVNSGRALNMNADLAGSDGLQLQGGGTLNIFAPVTLTGGVTIIGSTLAVLPSGSFIPAANTIGDGPISLSEGGSLLLRGNNTSSSQVFIGTGGGTLQNRGNNVYQTTGILTGSGTLTFTTTAGSGGRTWQFNSTDNDFTGGFVLTNGSQALQVNSLVDSTNNIAFNAGGQFRYGTGADAALTLNERAFELNAGTGVIENLNTSHAITVNTDLIATGAGAKTLSLRGNAGPTNIFAGLIADETDEGEGTVALTKEGASTWVLGGDNTYTGATTISGGRLVVNGDQSAATGPVAVNGSATLGGSGTLGGDVTVAAGANLAATLSFGGDLNISATAGGNGQLFYELGSIAASDQIAVSGALDIGEGLLGFGDFDFTNVGGLEEGVYILITSSGISGSLDGDDLLGTIGETEGTLGISGNNIILTFSEPIGTPFELWAGPGVTFDGDESGDGVSNGLAFLLGAASPDDSALDILPEASEDAGGLVLTFSMRNAAARGSATLSIEHSSDLGIADAWTTVLVPETSGGPTSGVTFTVTPGSPHNSVTATISSGESANGKLFGRLKATE